ncbi:unnamed protein product [Moneuplotes crassus]|uniref:Transmembrane protein n=1 Tax=Euplotes crassus TaxID=5936 RepID=A0AAD1XV90_EUPCR|nr:unnamed protein product [Moneuplotes crassus]
MKSFIILLIFIALVASNQCKDKDQEMGASLSASFCVSGATSCNAMKILDDSQKDLLYIVGFYIVGSSSSKTFVYKTDYEFQKLKVATYPFSPQFRSPQISLDGDFIYIQAISRNKTLEISTATLETTRELIVSGSKFAYRGNMIIRNYFYLSFHNSSITETCRWNKVSTNLDCLSFGVGSHTNFIPINDEILFYGSSDSSFDQYYLIGYNFSDPSNLVWKKSIDCPISSCNHKDSPSILSRDGKSIYTMILYNEHFLFYKLNATDGSPLNPGFIWNDSNYYSSYSMAEFEGFVVVQINSAGLTNRKRLILVNKDNDKVLKEYGSIGSQAYFVGRASYQGIEVLYHGGYYSPGPAALLARTSTNNIDQLSEFQQDTPLFTQISSNYQVSSTTSSPTLTSSTKTLIISSSSTVTATDITSTTTPSFTTYVALWNDDHVQSVQSNSLVKVDFTWACAQPVNYTDISFSLVQTGSHSIPKWVQANVVKQELYLNMTPQLSEATTYYFSLKIVFSSEVHYKQFEITVEECNIQHCTTCQLGDTSLCQICEANFQVSENQQSCSEAPIAEKEVDAQIATASTALVASGAIIASASSLLSLSSVNSIFSTMNSLQLAILMPAVPEYFPQKVSDLINGMGFSTFSFDFMSLRSIPFVEAVSNWISYPQTNEYLLTLGMSSGSSLVNLLSILGTIILICITHFCITILYKCGSKSESKRCTKMCKKLFRYFTFNIYIRILIQSFMFISLCILSELHAQKLQTTLTQVSFAICILFGVLCILFVVSSLCMYSKSFSNAESLKYQSCMEYFNGVKPTKFAKLYSCLFMLLRVFCSFLAACGKSTLGSQTPTYFYLSNIGYCLYLLIVRPFTNPQDNLIEIVNQTLFCCLAVPLMCLRSESDWTPFYERYYTSVFMVSPLIVSFICLMFLAKTILVCIRKMKRARPSANVAPKNACANGQQNHQESGQDVQDAQEFDEFRQNHEERKHNFEDGNSVVGSKIRSNSNISKSNAEIMDPPRTSKLQGLEKFRRNKVDFPNKVEVKRREY